MNDSHALKCQPFGERAKSIQGFTTGTGNAKRKYTEREYKEHGSDGELCAVANSGIPPRNIIVEVDHRPVTTGHELKQIVEKHRKGAPIPFLVHRSDGYPPRGRCCARKLSMAHTTVAVLGGRGVASAKQAAEPVKNSGQRPPVRTSRRKGRDAVSLTRPVRKEPSRGADVASKGAE